MSGPEDNPRDDDPMDRDEYEAWEKEHQKELTAAEQDEPYVPSGYYVKEDADGERLIKKEQSVIDVVKCDLCGEPMPAGETMCKFHGYSGPCPKPPLAREESAPSPSGDRYTGMHVKCGGVTFSRLTNGDVALSYYVNGVPKETIINDGHWGSLVLSMTAFTERPNDWNRFMDHHQGRKDLLPPL